MLVTGGAGFLGAHLARELLRRGYRVRALDALVPQVHGEGGRRPAYLEEDVELVVGDVRDPAMVRRALVDVDRVVHFAARVGVGQSMYEIAEYTSVNVAGTGVLLDALIEHRVRRLLVASSMSVYGEGLYRDDSGQVHERITRTREQLERGLWDPAGPGGQALEPVPTPEQKPLGLASIYALNKYDQERMCLIAGEAYGIPTVALRFWNVYGPHQALSNPYTGVLAIFAARLLNGRPPVIFEDGRQQRDFVHVRDVADACRLALEVDGAAGGVFNIGSGRSISIGRLAERMARVLGRPLAPNITGEYRVGDIRHCVPDITLAQRVLGYQPTVKLDVGLAELAAWLETQEADDRVDTMRAELVRRGLSL